MITEKILNDFRNGHKPAFDEIYKAYSSAMYGISLRYTKCQDDAQDILQEAFIKVYVHREKFEINQSIGAWIKTITINTALTYIKQNYRFKLIEDDVYFDGIDTEIDNGMDIKVLQEKLLSILRNLPDGYRTIFNLYVIDNLTHKEIAEYLNISENTSKTQLFKAKKMIQQIIDKEKADHGTVYRS